MAAVIDWRVWPSAAHGSARSDPSRAGTVASVNCAGGTPASTSSQASGAETVAPGPGRVGPDRGRAAGVAQIVDINPALALPLQLIGGIALGMARGQRVGDGFGEGFDLVPAEPRGDRHDDVQSLAAGSLGKAVEPEPRQEIADLEGGFGDPRPGQALVRVEVKGDPIGLFDLAQPRSPGMDFDDADLHQ